MIKKEQALGVLVCKAAPQEAGRDWRQVVSCRQCNWAGVRAWVMPVLLWAFPGKWDSKMENCRVLPSTCIKTDVNRCRKKQKQLGCSLVDITALLIYFGITRELHGL